MINSFIQLSRYSHGNKSLKWLGLFLSIEELNIVLPTNNLSAIYLFKTHSFVLQFCSKTLNSINMANNVKTIVF